MADTQAAPVQAVDVPAPGSLKQAEQALVGLLDSLEEQPEPTEAEPTEELESTDEIPDEDSQADSEDETEELVEDDPQEDTDDDEPEEESAGDEEDSDPLYQVRVDGEELEVNLEELLKSYSRQSDYTRKTQALSEQQKDIDTLTQQHQAEIQQIQQERQQYMDSLTQVIENANLDKFNVDWERLKAEDPLEYITKKQEFADAKEKVQQLQQQQQQAATRQQQAQQEQLQQHMRYEHEQLVEKLPDWGEPEKQTRLAGDMRSYLSDQGYVPEEIDGLIDHRSFIVAHKAMMYDALQKADPKAKKLKNKPRVVRGGKGTTKAKAQRDRVQQNRNRLKQTGHVRDAARALEDFI
jgi:predicted nucleic-acid-binding protein